MLIHVFEDRPLVVRPRENRRDTMSVSATLLLKSLVSRENPNDASDITQFNSQLYYYILYILEILSLCLGGFELPRVSTNVGLPWQESYLGHYPWMHVHIQAILLMRQ